VLGSLLVFSFLLLVKICTSFSIGNRVNQFIGRINPGAGYLLSGCFQFGFDKGK
jgi:hypothetical protein